MRRLQAHPGSRRGVGLISIEGRLASIRHRIEEACRRAGRRPDEVTLLGASKRQPIAALVAAHRAGLRDFGENRVQEGEAKRPELATGCTWHLIGTLQSNKARRAVEVFDVVHSVDRLKIARALDRHAREAGRILPIFLEVNQGAEDSKHGIVPPKVQAAVEAIRGLDSLRLEGLMSIPPPGPDAESSRPWFRRLAELSRQIEARFEDWPGRLSMGMSADFEIAIEEGATHVRLGTALFGPRDP